MQPSQPTHLRLRSSAVLACAATWIFTGCILEHESRKKIDLGVAAQANPYAASAAFRDTIGSKTYYQGMAPLSVRGYGLVVGLGSNGASDCPPRVFNRLVQAMYKQPGFTSNVVGIRRITPERLIESIDTAVVIVQGEILPGAVGGSRFDVVVTALPGTQTKSLRGGRLYTTHLERFRRIGANTTIVGKKLARASGPIFLNPFSEDEAATRSTDLEGVILGGGLVIADRTLRLVLLEPSYHWAQRIQDRINAFAPASKKVADAISPSFVRLRIPREFHNDTGHFLALVRGLYLSRDPRFAAARARQLADEIAHPMAPHGQIAQCLEGLGRAALPVLDDLYAHPKEHVSFFAAAAGLRLGDYVASDVMALHARNPDSPYRFRAIRALGAAKGMAGAGMCLRSLLDDEDPRIQVAAYEALIVRFDPVIRSMSVGGDNFRLDQIPTQRPGFIFVKRKGSRRIALFGENLRCLPPILYQARDGSITISARPGDLELTLMRVVVASGSTSPPVQAPLTLPELIQLLGNDADVDVDGDVIGMGLDYGAVVRALYHLCQAKAVNAHFMLEQPNAGELFGPPKPRGRPESELSATGR